MTHARLARQLSAFLDGELPPAQVRQVAAHLKTCALCTIELARLERVKSLLGRLPEPEPPEEVWPALRSRVEYLDARPFATGLTDLIRSAFRRPAAAAVAIAAVVILMLTPFVKGRLDRLQAADIGVDVYVREHALRAAPDPFVDRAYIGLLIGDTNLALAGERRQMGDER